MNKAQQLELLPGQHRDPTVGLPLPEQPKTNHERTLSVPYVFRNPLISREKSKMR